MAIVNGIIEEGTPIGKSIFSFMGVNRRADGKLYWQDLVFAPNINPRSRIKPMEYNGPNEVRGETVYGQKTRLTYDQMKSVNWGHTMTRYSNALEAIRGAITGENFPYHPPTSWYRPADYWGYNHYAGNWHTLTTQVSKVSVGSATKFTLSNILDIFNFQAVIDAGMSLTNCNFGFLMANGEFTSEQAQVYFYSVTDYRDATKQLDAVLNGTEGGSLPTTNIGEGTWYMYPCITSAQFSQYSMTYIREENDNGYWFPFPFCNTHVLEVVGAGEGGEIIIGNISLDVDKIDYSLMQVDTANLVYAMGHLMLPFSNTANANYSVTYSVEIKGAIGEYNKPTLSGAFTIAAGSEDSPSYADVVVFEAKDEESWYRFQLGESSVVLSVTYRLQTENGLQTETQDIDLFINS